MHIRLSANGYPVIDLAPLAEPARENESAYEAYPRPPENTSDPISDLIAEKDYLLFELEGSIRRYLEASRAVISECEEVVRAQCPSIVAAYLVNPSRTIEEAAELHETTHDVQIVEHTSEGWHYRLGAGCEWEGPFESCEAMWSAAYERTRH